MRPSFLDLVLSDEKYLKKLYGEERTFPLPLHSNTTLEEISSEAVNFLGSPIDKQQERQSQMNLPCSLGFEDSGTQSTVGHTVQSRNSSLCASEKWEVTVHFASDSLSVSLTASLLSMVRRRWSAGSLAPSLCIPLSWTGQSEIKGGKISPWSSTCYSVPVAALPSSPIPLHKGPWCFTQ